MGVRAPATITEEEVCEPDMRWAPLHTRLCATVRACTRRTAGRAVLRPRRTRRDAAVNDG
ncbi:hypothetical protein GCM10023082_17380 [Streptomyces tremellae]|uniref:Transposase n=1 Tax=Streptomyces tremellae TaxID=1124239 RepID=A0ABP7ENG9_9ACTN